MTLITEVRQAVIARLQSIQVAGGYLTDAGGNVLSGWFNEVIKDQAIGNGLIVLQRAKAPAPPVDGGEAIKVFLGFSVVGAVEAGLENYEAGLEALETDLLTCLLTEEGAHVPWLPKGCSGLKIGAPEVFPPGDGQTASTVLIPIQLTAVISRQG